MLYNDIYFISFGFANINNNNNISMGILKPVFDFKVKLFF